MIPAFPAPIVFGLVVDSTCLVLQGCAGSRRGACLVYDNAAFRWKMHLFTVGVKFMALIMYTIGLFVSRNVSYYEEKENVDDEDKEMKEISKEEMDEFRNEKFS